MDRPDSIKGAILLQCLIGLAYLGIGKIFLIPIRPRNEGEAILMAGVPSPPIAFGMIAIGLLGLLGAYGMWRGRRWGWLLALLVDLGTSFGSAYQTIKDFSYLNAAQITFGVALAIVPIGWLILPGVLKFYWRS